jgi:hypothetical protein
VTAWTVLLEVEADREAVNRLREMLQDLLELTTGDRPRTRTIETAAFNAALHPPEPKLPPRSHEPSWSGVTVRRPVERRRR